MSLPSLPSRIRELATRARAAAERLAELSSREKNAWLLRAAERLEAAENAIRQENRRDLRQAESKGVAAPLLGRLEISEGKWADMIAGLREVAALPDPVGSVEQMRVRPNGLRVGRLLCRAVCTIWPFVDQVPDETRRTETQSSQEEPDSLPARALTGGGSAPTPFTSHYSAGHLPQVFVKLPALNY